MWARNIDQDRNRYRAHFVEMTGDKGLPQQNLRNEWLWKSYPSPIVIDTEMQCFLFRSIRPGGSRETRIWHSVRRLVAAKDIPKKSSGTSKEFVLLEHEPSKEKERESLKTRLLSICK
jgi:hypothetical protein